MVTTKKLVTKLIQSIAILISDRFIYRFKIVAKLRD